MLKRLLIVGLLIIAAPAAAAPPVILVLGDSLSAGYGFDLRQGWVTLLQQRLAREGCPHRVVNASISGDTARGGLARLPRALDQHRPAIVIIELGGNDGLRGLPLAELRANLGGAIQLAQKHGAKVLLVGMRLPTNYGTSHTREFHELYQACAGPRYVRRDFPVSLAPSVSAQPCGVRLRLHRPRPPCGPANTAGPQWLYGTKGPPASPVGPVPTSYYAPSLRYPWRAAPELGRRYRVPVVPFFLEGVATVPELMQPDGVHPTAAAQPKLLATVWPYLAPLL